MPETLLTPSSIKMFGRMVSSLQYSDDTKKIGDNNFLQKQLSYAGDLLSIKLTGDIDPAPKPIRQVTLPLQAYPLADPYTQIVAGMLVTGVVPGAAPDVAQAFAPGTHIISFVQQDPPKAPQGGAAPTPGYFTVSADPLINPVANIAITLWLPSVNIARIYAFSFEGAVYTLPKPSMFLVHGPGGMIDITGTARGGAGERWSFGNIGRTDLDQSGVMAREWEFSAPNSQDKFDLRYWEYEKGDFLMRLDTEAGPLEQILLAAALRGADGGDRATGIRSGASLAGASVSGASLSGASLSGASLSGASLSGASLRR
jgi:hypothetical protein